MCAPGGGAVTSHDVLTGVKSKDSDGGSAQCGVQGRHLEGFGGGGVPAARTRDGESDEEEASLFHF